MLPEEAPAQYKARDQSIGQGARDRWSQGWSLIPARKPDRKPERKSLGMGPRAHHFQTFEWSPYSLSLNTPFSDRTPVIADADLAQPVKPQNGRNLRVRRRWNRGSIRAIRHSPGQ